MEKKVIKRLSGAPRRRGGTKKRGRGGLKEGKTPVIVLERSGKSIFFVALEGLSEELVLHLLDRHVEKGSVVNTDDFPIYTAEIERRSSQKETFTSTTQKTDFHS